MTNTFSRNVRGQTSDLNQGDTREGAGIGDKWLEKDLGPSEPGADGTH